MQLLGIYRKHNFTMASGEEVRYFLFKILPFLLSILARIVITYPRDTYESVLPRRYIASGTNQGEEESERPLPKMRG